MMSRPDGSTKMLFCGLLRPALYRCIFTVSNWPNGFLFGLHWYHSKQLLFISLFAPAVGNRARMEEQQQRERQLFFRAHPYASQIPGQVSEVM